MTLYDLQKKMQEDLVNNKNPFYRAACASHLPLLNEEILKTEFRVSELEKEKELWKEQPVEQGYINRIDELKKVLGEKEK